MQDGTYEIIKIIIGEGSIIGEWRLRRDLPVYFYFYEQEILRKLARNGCLMKYGNCIQNKCENQWYAHGDKARNLPIINDCFADKYTAL